MRLDSVTKARTLVLALHMETTRGLTPPPVDATVIPDVTPAARFLTPAMLRRSAQ